MTTKMKTVTARLFWNERGQIGCELPGHAPYRGTDSWKWERWKRITPAQAGAFERELGRPPACEVCAAIARRDARGEGLDCPLLPPALAARFDP